MERKKIDVSAFVSNVCKPLSGQNINLAKASFPHLQGISLADDKNYGSRGKIDILIGADHYWNFFNKCVIQGENGGPVALGSIFGFILSGPIYANRENFESSCMTVGTIETHSLKISAEQVNNERGLLSELRKFNDLETIGINSKDANERDVFSDFSEQIDFVNNRYQVRLPFKENHLQLTDNYELSRNCVFSMRKKFKGNKELLHEYNNLIEKHIDQGVIEEAGPISEAGVSHYLAHHVVINENSSTTRLRVVFGASFKTEGPSLNDCLSTGPSLTPSLFGVLSRFRTHNVVVIGDIEKAFYQISVHPDDRNFLRFIWFKNVENLDSECFEHNELVEYRFRRVIMGVTSSPFLLSGTLNKHFNEHTESNELAEKYLQSIHVDDLTTGEESESK